MSKKLKSKEFNFTFSHFIRLIIFSLLFYFLISFLQSQRHLRTANSLPDPTILGDTVSATTSATLRNWLEDSLDNISPLYRDKIESITQSDKFLEATQTFRQIQEKLTGFPQNQIKQIQKFILNKAYEDFMQKLESN